MDNGRTLISIKDVAKVYRMRGRRRACLARGIPAGGSRRDAGHRRLRAAIARNLQVDLNAHAKARRSMYVR